jgi:preprotein translocase subunit SecG
MYGLLITVELLVSMLLIIVVLMQSSKGSGLAGSFGGGSMGTVFGVRRTADLLSRGTTILASLFIALCLLINIFFLPGKKEATESIIQRGSSQSSVPRPNAPRATQPATTPQQQPSGK